MRTDDLIRTGWINLWRRKTRTLLTALSMTIGVMCIVVLISIGIGYGKSYEETVESMGSITKIDVTPAEKMGEGQKSALLNDKAVESFKGISGVEAVTPVVQTTGYLKSGSYVAMAKLYGIDLTTAESFLLTPTEGGMPGEGMRLHPELMVTDDLAASFADPNRDWQDAVDANGEPLVDALRSPINLTFDYNTLNGTQAADSEGRASGGGTFYTLDIRGVCSSLNYTYATSAFMDIERLEEWQEITERQNAAATGTPGSSSAASTESSTAQTESSGSDSGNQTQQTKKAAVNADTERATVQTGASSSARGGRTDKALLDTYELVWIKAEDVGDVEKISSLIEDAGFSTYSLNDMLETVKKQSRQIQGMLGAIGLVAMLVSGICVANTMMMSINERTREVGILKVLGTEFSDIAKMFLTEACLVGLAGGVAGIVLSFAMSWLIPVIFAGMELRCIIPWWLVIGGILFAGAVALIAAWVPAKNAMAISPNEAIRSE